MEHLKKKQAKRFYALVLGGSILGIAIMAYPLARLGLGIAQVFARGWSVLPDIGECLVTTLHVLALVLLIVVPVAFGIALWMYEFAHRKAVERVRAFMTGWAWMPSVFLGLLGWLLIGRHLGASVISMVAVLSLFVLPFMVMRFEQALHTVPETLRFTGLSLGASRMAVLINLTLPKAIWEILRSVVMCIERILGEATALLILVGTLPENGTLSMELFRLSWIGRADAAILAGILLLVLVCLRLFTARRWNGERSRRRSGYGWHMD